MNIPTVGLKGFVENLAATHGITYSKTVDDEWAGAVTRLAGDNVAADGVEDLVVALRRAHVIDADAMVMILGNYYDERKGKHKQMTDQDQIYRRTIFKHSDSAGRDCPIEWKVCFGTMEIQLRADFISPALLIDCLRHIPRADDRFQFTGITDPLSISGASTSRSWLDVKCT